ncbi:MAG: hypothetical protein M1837_003265 [Sclerophora amabilis]|nr:MAG: hypothetical protein M1837_003265 [Sclerophora amabilis]
MGWEEHSTCHRDASHVERQQRRDVRRLLETYRQKCVSTCLMYPTFLSSTVILTVGAVHNCSQNGGALRRPRGEKHTSKASARRTSSPAFFRFWGLDAIRDEFLSSVSKSDLPAMRLVCRDFGFCAAPLLFKDITVTFRSGTFTRPARMAALERIGCHVRTLTFRMPHSAETFLPPLLDPVTGEEQVFLYEPQVSPRHASDPRTRGPKYGSWEMTDLLIKQYGPLFHSATNVPSFVRALTAMPSMRHLKISCPGQEPSQRYRRSAVDYALISLRIAIERAPLERLSTLSLLPIHPGGVYYLRPTLSFGSTPRSSRRWAQIRKLAIHMESWQFYQRDTRTDHLKLLHTFLGFFSSTVTRLLFRWKGDKGPCPFTLDSDPLLRPPSRKQRPRRILFPKLQNMELSNVCVDASQICTLINRHRRSLRECDFEEVQLRNGDWDDALAVLTRISGSERWKERQQVVESPLPPPPPPPPAPRLPPLELPLLDQRYHPVKWGRESYFGSPDHMREFFRTSVALVQ